MPANIRNQSLPSYFNGSRRLGEAVEWMGSFNTSSWFNPYNKILDEEKRQLLDINQTDSTDPKAKNIH